jgi:hypothetical protein
MFGYLLSQMTDREEGLLLFRLGSYFFGLIAANGFG